MFQPPEQGPHGSPTIAPNVGTPTTESGGNMLFNDYINHLYAKRQSEGTIKLRLHYMRHLQREHSDIYKVTPMDLDKFLAEHGQWKPETVGAVVSTFKGFYKWATLAKKVKTNPALHLERPRVEVLPAKVTPDAVIEEALETCSLRDATFLLLGRQGGLRRSEMAHLRTTDRNGDQLSVLGKGNKRRFVHIYGDLLACLLQLEAEGADGYYFPGRFGGHITPEMIYYIVTKLTGVNPHGLRHAAGTSFYDKGKDLRLTQEFLGHANSKTTERYAHVSRDALVAGTERAGLRAVSRFSAPVTTPDTMKKAA